MNEKDKRPWWQKKINIGIIILFVGEGFALIPITAPFSPIVIKLGSVLAGIGAIHREVKEHQ